MPPASKRNFFCFVVDILSPFARRNLDKIIVHKALLSSKDESALYMLNSPRQVRRLSPSSAMKNMFDYLDAADDAAEHAGELPPPSQDWVTAVESAAPLAFDLGQRISAKTTYIVLISEFLNPSTATDEDMRKCCAALSENDIQFVVILNQTVEYSIDRPIKVWADVEEAMEDITIKNQTLDVKKIMKISEESNGIVTDERNALDFILLAGKYLPKQDWLVPLQLGKHSFPTITRKLIAFEDSLFPRSMKRKYESNYVEEAGWDDNLTSTSQVKEEDIVDAYKCLGRYFILPKDITANLSKPNTTRTFKIIGFVPKDQLPEIFFGGKDTMSIIANPNMGEESLFFEFVNAVREAEVYAIAVRVYVARSGPRLFVLLPQKDWFLMTDLGDSIKEKIFPKPVREAVDVDTLSAPMLKLREHLLNRKRSIFHPSGEVGPYRRLIMRNIREHVGYNKHVFEEEDLVHLDTGLEDVDLALGEQVDKMETTDADDEEEW